MARPVSHLASLDLNLLDVKDWLIEQCGRTAADLRRAGKDGLNGYVRFAGDEPPGPGGTFTRILPSRQAVP
jgi:hypothetical protein